MDVPDTRCVEIRGALDIGSSQHKLVVARVRVAASGNRPLEVVDIMRETQIAVYLNDAFVAANCAELSAGILSESETALRKLVQLAREDGAGQIAGVATAVFRKAANGESYLARISDTLCITIRLVTQQMEGELGFMSALAQLQLHRNVKPSSVSASVPGLPPATGVLNPPSCAISADSLVSWDSGGGSFQLAAAMERKSHEQQEVSDSEILVFQGPIGNANVLALLCRVRGTTFSPGKTCNPVSEDEFTELTRLIAQEISAVQVPHWLRNRLDQPDSLVVGIGNRTSLFCVGRDATSKEEFTAQDVRESSRALLGKDDVALDRYMRECAARFHSEASYTASNDKSHNLSTRQVSSMSSSSASYPEPKTVVCKLALLYTVMTQLQIRSVRYQQTMGSCPGILLDDILWTKLGMPPMDPALEAKVSAPTRERAGMR